MTGMAEDIGPIDYLIVEFPGDRQTGEGLPLLVDLVDRATIRVIDLVFVRKALDNSIVVLTIADLDRDGQLDLAVFEGASSGLLDEEDIDNAGTVLRPGNSAAILIYENLWAKPLATALRRGGAQLVAGGPIPHSNVVAALDSLEPVISANENRWDHTMPGLLRGVARTAVIAGTATAVSNRVSRRQAGRWARQAEQQASTPQPATSIEQNEMLAQLRELGELRNQGVLTDEEFEQQKNRILNP